jgi:nucleoside-diphosphate-sugar epimerase
METVVFTGAAGYVGGLLARAYAGSLGAASVRCLFRTAAQAEILTSEGFGVGIGDVRDPGTVATLIPRGATLIHAAARLGSAPGHRRWR